MTNLQVQQYFKDAPVREARQVLGFCTDIVEGRVRPARTTVQHAAKATKDPKAGMDQKAATQDF